MNMAQRVATALEDADQGKLLPAMLHACAAIDGTGAKLFPGKGNRDRFVATFDRYLWVIEPMFATGINLGETTFTWIQLKNKPARMAEIIYEIFRCNLAHGTEIPPTFQIVQATSPERRTVRLGQQELTIPHTIIYALLGAAVFSAANSDQRINNENYFLSCGTMFFTIDDWWGREEDAKTCFSTVRMPRIAMNFDAERDSPANSNPDDT